MAGARLGVVTLGLVAQPNSENLRELGDLFYSGFPQMTEEERLAAIEPFEGRWAIMEAKDEYIDELNLRTYTHAQRFIYGTQAAVTATHTFARRNPRRRIAVTPAPARLHFLEDHPTEPGVMQAVKVIDPQPAPPRAAQRRSPSR